MKSKRIASGFMPFALVTLAMAFAVPCLGQEPPEKRKTEEKATEAKEKPEDGKEKAKDKASTITAVVGARIMTVTQGTIRDGTVLIRDGKILAVGQDLTIPEGAEVIDASGKIVTPGFICLDAGSYGVSGTASGESQVKDALNPFDHNMEFLLGVGITTICSSSGESSGFRGSRGSRGQRPPPTASGFKNTPQLVLKMSYGEMDGMFVKENPFYMVGGSSFRGGLNSFTWREALNKARDYLKKQQAPPAPSEASATQQRQGQSRGQRPGGRPPQGESAQRPGAEKKEQPPVSEDILRLMRGEIALRTDARTVDQIRDAIALAKEFDYRLILDGVEEGWLIADEFGQAVEYAIISPRSIPEPQKRREESTGGSIALSRCLEKSGVPFAVKPRGGSVSFSGGMIGDSITGLPTEAMFAVSGGCGNQSALESITIVPARMMGLADRLGSIEIGKDADLLILDGHPLDYKTHVDRAIVNGNAVYKRDVNRVYPVFDRSLYDKADDKVDPQSVSSKNREQ